MTAAVPQTTREAYQDALAELAAADPRVFCVDADTGPLADSFGERFPDRYLNVGIAEANMMSVAAGLAAAGHVVYAHTMCGFATARAAEQLKLDVAGANLPVRVVGTHGGLSAGHYGPTHHALDDLAVARTMPNLTVVVPCGPAQTRRVVHAVADLAGPVYVRLGRGPTPPVDDRAAELRLGRALVRRPGDDVTIVATGPYPVLAALDAHARLSRQGIGARVLDMFTVKPIDAGALVAAARQTAGIVTVEDHLIVGGLGGSVCEVVAEEHPCPVRRVGVPDAFFDRVGDEAQLLTDAGVTAEAVVSAALTVLAGRRGGA